MTRLATVAIALTLAGVALPTQAQEPSLPDTLREFERQAEDLLGEEGRRAVERLLPMIESLMERLPLVIDNLPQYELPEILPNGDIIIRRKRAPLPSGPDLPSAPEDGIKT